MTFFFGATTDATGTALTSGNKATFAANIASGGCGPFGIWEGSPGEVATELEMRLNTRLGVFAMADGIVIDVQAASQPYESGEVEGVWVRYGENYVIKYVHVKDPTVTAGNVVTAGQRLGVTPDICGGLFFLESEVRKKQDGKLYALAWSTLLNDSGEFDSLYGSGNCIMNGTLKGTDGTTTTTASHWKNDALNPGEYDVSFSASQCFQ